MKNDALINIKIGKKTTLCLAAILSFFAAADFVSLVDSKNAGGVIIEKETMTVGSVVLRMDNINPTDIYGGTWNLITGDATLAFGDGTIQNGLASGENNPAVPLVKHNHGMSHGHGFRWKRGGQSGSAANYIERGERSSDYNTQSSSAIANFNGNTADSGVSNATLDVRGSRIKINVWQRTN